MDNFSIDIQLRWADMDPNFHLRHSVYYDWGALCRMEFLVKMGLTPQIMQKKNFGPILFREECVFKKEIHYGNKVSMNMEISKARRDYSRWSIRHNIYKSEDTVSAIITVDGAWINTIERKLFIPPKEAIDVFSQMPVSSDFSWAD